MGGNSLEIVCTACGAETFVRREPVYEGFKKTGERYVCVSCGHAFAGESEVPFKSVARPAVFTDEDVPRTLEIFAEEEKGRNCRHCRHYTVNPFTQRCGLHLRVVQATDLCDDFEVRADDDETAQHD